MSQVEASSLQELTLLARKSLQHAGYLDKRYLYAFCVLCNLNEMCLLRGNLKKLLYQGRSRILCHYRLFNPGLIHSDIINQHQRTSYPRYSYIYNLVHVWKGKQFGGCSQSFSIPLRFTCVMKTVNVSQAI